MGDKKKDTTEFIHSTYLDNEYLSPVQREYLESKRGDGNNNFWRVYGLGEIGVADGLVFSNFEVADFDRDGFDKYFYGIDWGFSEDPFAFVECAKEGRNLYICREIYQKGLLNREAIPLVKEIAGESLIIADSAEPKSVAEFCSAGLHCIGAKKGKGSIESGIKYLQSFNNIYIHPSCPHIAAEFKNYEWRRDKMTASPLPEPVDDWNHGIDATRYALSYQIGDFREHEAG